MLCLALCLVEVSRFLKAKTLLFALGNVAFERLRRADPRSKPAFCPASKGIVGRFFGRGLFDMNEISTADSPPPPWPEPQGWPGDAQKERIIGDWWFYQRSGGHRTSTDDVLTAYFAVRRFLSAAKVDPPGRYLDLGCGVGSVLLMVAHRLRPKLCLGIEAQPQSVAMAQRSVDELPVGAPAMQILAGDIRDKNNLEKPCDLITGSPPYFPLGTGTLPPDAQRRACRFEARGGVEAYCEAASLHLAPQARFYVVFQTTWRSRVERAAARSGLQISARLEAHMREDRPAPFLDVFEMTRGEGPRGEELAIERFAIRDREGEISAEYRCAREFLGVDPHRSSFP